MLSTTRVEIAEFFSFVGALSSGVSAGTASRGSAALRLHIVGIAESSKW